MGEEGDSNTDPVDRLEDVLDGARPPDAADEDPLSPDDLDIAERDGVRKRGERQYVVSTDPDAEPTPGGATAADADADAGAPVSPPGEGSLDASADAPRTPAADPARARLERSGDEYGVVLAAKTDAGVAQTTVTSNNIVATFEDALTWYAAQVDDSLPPEAVVELLLEQSGLDVDP